MKQYSEVTPATQLMDTSFDLDVFKSAYANMRYGANPQELVTIDAKYEANLPGLAFDYYGDMSMWRVILSFNGLVDPINDVVTGMTLAMPDKSSVDAYITQGSTSTKKSTLYI